jgi:hypothetical protein
MKTPILFTLFAVITIPFFSQCSKQTGADQTESVQTLKNAPKSDPEARAEYEWRIRVNREINGIPEGIYDAEYQWALTSPKRLRKASNTYSALGPNNLGGRTRSIVCDVRGSVTMLAGGVSSGVFKTTNGGTTWTKVSASNQIHNVTSIVQDTRSGQEDTWYYSTGEASGNSASNSGGAFGLYMGNGVYKSTDNGITWSRLTTSNSTALETFNHWADFIQKLAVDPTNGDVYMACLGSIFRSTNGGTSWSAVLQVSTGSLNSGWQADIIITPAGRKYIAFAGSTNSGSNDYNGVWVSQTGDASSWTQIAGNASPTGWNAKNAYGRVVLAYAPSDTAKIYALYSNNTTSNCGGSPAPEAELFKYNNGTSSWTNLSAYLPDESGCSNGNDPFACQDGYDLCIAIKPDDANTIVIGGTNAYRSTDGFTSTSNTKRIGGYATASGYSKYTNHHPDVHTLIFDPNDADVMYSGTDGGIHSCDITATTVAWTSLNNNYQTYQYYHVALAPDAYKEQYIGGCQDNGTVRCLSNNASQTEIWSGDGCGVGIAQVSGTYTEFVSFQNGSTFRRLSTVSPFSYNAEITPSGFSSKSDFVTYFHLDPDNNQYLYYANGDDLVRNTSATTATTTVGWTNMTGVNGQFAHDIFAFATTRGFYSAGTASLFIGTANGDLFRLDDPVNAAASATATNITPTSMSGAGIIKDISVNPRNDDTIMVVYSNYGVNSVWWTGNANSGSPTWVNVEGNISVPSIRSCEIVQTSTGFEYYIGTSVGLYSATTLNGGSTTWAQEGSSTIGYALITSMDYRPDDNTLLVGTHGNGLYLAEVGNAAYQAIGSSVASTVMALGANETKLFKTSDGSIATIQNLDNFNYGNTTVEIDNAGTGAVNFSTNTANSQKITEKSIKITPTNANGSGNVKITMYFSATELSNWKSTTGWYAKDLALIKSTGSISSGTSGNTVEGTSIVIDSTYNGAGLSITCTFSNGFSGLGGAKGGGGGPLPVTWLMFETKKEAMGINLKWETASEINSSHFEVHRAINGGAYSNIGEVKSIGTTSNTSSYSFVDMAKEAVLATNVCYQLKQMDYNGIYDWSVVRCVTGQLQRVDFNIYPNPVNQVLSIDINPWSVDQYSFNIIDLNGKTLYSSPVITSSSKYDLSSLKEGVYFIALKSDGVVIKQQKLVKY